MATLLLGELVYYRFDIDDVICVHCIPRRQTKVHRLLHKCKLEWLRGRKEEESLQVDTCQSVCVFSPSSERQTNN